MFFLNRAPKDTKMFSSRFFLIIGVCAMYTMIQVIKHSIKEYKIFVVDENEIPIIENLIPENLPTFKGT